MKFLAPQLLLASQYSPETNVEGDKTGRQKDKIHNSFVLFQTPYFVGFYLTLLMNKTKRQLKKVNKSLDKNARSGAGKAFSFYEQCCSQSLSFCHNVMKSTHYDLYSVFSICLFARSVFLSFFKNGEQS